MHGSGQGKEKGLEQGEGKKGVRNRKKRQAAVGEERGKGKGERRRN